MACCTCDRTPVEDRHTVGYQLQHSNDSTITPHTSSISLQWTGEGVGRKMPLDKGKERTRDKLCAEMTYCFLSLISFSSIDGIVVLCDVQMEIMLIWKVLVAFAASVHVDLLIVHIVILNRRESQRLVWRQ